MRAVECDGHGDESVLRVVEVERPDPGPGELRIRVAGAGVNRADLLQRRGLYPPPRGASTILGLEVAGWVSAVGSGVTRWREGDRVMALLSGGGYAEEAVAAEGSVMATPPGLDDTAAGGVPEVFLTAYLNLFMIAHVAAGDVALVHGGSGGVGTAAIQMLRQAGVVTVVTAGSAERVERCLAVGASHAFNYHEGSIVDGMREHTPYDSVDVVLDSVGAAYLDDHLQLLGRDGRLVIIGLMGGAHANLDLGKLLTRRLSIIGSTLRSRSDADKAELVGSFTARFGSALADGAIAPVIDRVLTIDEVAAAHRALASGEVFGKIVLRP